MTPLDIYEALAECDTLSKARWALGKLYRWGLLHRWQRRPSRGLSYEYEAKGDLEWLMKYVAWRFFDWYGEAKKTLLEDDNSLKGSTNDE